MWTNAKAAVLCVPTLLVSVVAGADSMWVPSVELRERESGRYWLDALVAPAVVSGIHEPVPPARCEVQDPERHASEGLVRVRYGIDCGDDPLAPRDAVLLPWAVDGIQLTVFWVDGVSRRALFGREPAGVIIRLQVMMEREASVVELVKEYGTEGWRHSWTSASHLVFLLALALLARRVWIGLAGLFTGSALSLVLADLGLVGLPLVPADATYAGAAALLMAAFVNDRVDGRGLFALTTVLGTLHGLGTATALSGVTGSQFLEALFITNSGHDLGGVVLGLTGVLAWKLDLVRAGSSTRAPLGLAGLMGIAAVFFALAELREGLTRSASASMADTEAMQLDVDALPLSAGASAVAPAQPDPSGNLTSPFMSYLIVEPYQIRHEVLVDVKAVGEWVNVPVDDASRIPVSAQKQLAEDIVALVSERVAVTIDGKLAHVAAGRADFVVLGSTGTLTRETPIAEPSSEAIVGVTLVFDTVGLADAVALDWGLFSEVVTTVPVTVTDPSATGESALTPEAPRFEWRNMLRDFELPAIEPVVAAKRRLPLVSLVLGLVALAALVVGRKRSAVIGCLTLAYVLYPFVRAEASIPFIGGPRMDRTQAADVVESLLTNVYRCFDIHNEELIYDRLALTVTGDQLLEVYLESRRSLELGNRGGARVRIDEVIVRDVRSVRATGDGGHEIAARWTVGGSVSHFGHIHFRQNLYDATITIVPVEDTWKIRSFELEEEKRVL